MTVAALNWKFVGKTLLGGAAAIDDVLDELYTLFAKTTYDDGSSRTPGSGIAWNPTKYVDTVTKGVYCTPSSAGSSTCDGMRVIFAGHTSSITDFPLYNLGNFPTLTAEGAHYHSWNNSYLYGALAKNAGSFTNLSPGAAVTPFTSGGFTGFSYIADSAHNASGTLYVYESLDAVWLVFQDGSSGTANVTTFTAGGIIDPGSTDALDSEADDVLYGVLNSTNISQNNPAAGSNSYFPAHAAANNNRVSVLFAPGATTYTLIPVLQTMHPHGSDKQPFLRSGKIVLQPFYFGHYYDIGGTQYNAGRWREVFVGPKSNSGQEVTSGGDTVAYCVSMRGPGQTQYVGFLLKA